ncbi:MAG: universal stress protein [Hyphomicrobiales bacterium]|nr:universal stress protein [Hyphomicrobiales bacterium]
MSEPPEIVVKKGQVVGTLHDQVRDWPADLLVFGTHGRTGVGLAMLGSVAEEFVANSPCGLLIVKAW